MLIDDMYNEIGQMKLYIEGVDEKELPVFEDYFVNSAYSCTMRELDRLENSKDFIIAAETKLAVAQWFLSLESYVSFLLKVTCVVKKDNFSKYKRKDLPVRIQKLIELLGYNKEEVYKNNIKISLVNEFCRFRNELFHDYL